MLQKCSKGGMLTVWVLWLLTVGLPENCCGAEADDPLAIDDSLDRHLVRHLPQLPSYVALGDFSFAGITLTKAHLGNLTSLERTGTTFFWRKGIWFAVFGDLTIRDMTIDASLINIGSRNHTQIRIEENTIHFHWEALNTPECTVEMEKIEWLPLRRFSLENGSPLYLSDMDKYELKKHLTSAEFREFLRTLLIPCGYRSDSSLLNNQPIDTYV